MQTYLICTRASERIEYGKEQCCDKPSPYVSENEKPVHRSVEVHIRRRPQNRDCRDETCDERQRNRNRVHVAISEKEFLGGGLLPTRAAIVDPNPGRYGETNGENDIVPGGESSNVIHNGMCHLQQTNNLYDIYEVIFSDM